MKLLPFWLVTFLAITVVHAQKYGNIWQFGDYVGLDFNNCDPVVVYGNNTGFEGCSSISDSTGQLLFYTNSDVVWNKLHSVMPNGNLISSSGSLSQVLIVPKPLSTTLYYIITTKIQAGGSLTLQYHVVDMTLNGGQGDVASKNNVMSTLNITEQVSATYHSNGIDIWVVTHEYGSNKFLAFLVSSNGISTTPVTSNVGPSHYPCLSNGNARGELKFSPDGSKVAFNGNGVGGIDSSNILTICDFDNNTGQVSNPINLPYSRGEFGLSFSPDNTKLYGATWKAVNFSFNDYNYLYQFDLSGGTPAAIINSKQIIDSMQVPTSYGSLKLGPDGRIYVRHINSSYLGVINAPNQTGSACNYLRYGFYIGNQNYQYGLNNYIEYSSYCEATGVGVTFDTPLQIRNFPNPFSSQTVFQTSTTMENATVTVYNSFGVAVDEIKNVSGNKIIFYRNKLPCGLYIIHLMQNDMIITHQMIIVD